MEIKILDVADDIPHNDRAIRIGNLISNDNELCHLFGNRWDRMFSGCFTYLITVDNKDAGFINVLFERDDKEFLVVDMGIKKRYRSKGIGTEAMRKLKELNINKFIIAETMKNNIGGNKSLENISIKVAETNTCNYYLLQKERIEEFIDEDYLEKLANHYQEENFQLIKTS